MKTNYLLLLFCAISISAFSQQRATVITQGPRIAPLLPQPAPGYESLEPGSATEDPVSFRALETQIGVTRFELQTISSLGRRVATFDDGKVSAIWHFGADEPGGFPDRGAAYNHFDGNEWGAYPDGSLEEIRSGYPSFTGTTTGIEVVFSHKSESGNLWICQTHTKMPADTEWTAVEIPSTVGGGPVWGKVAAGGPDGNTLHAVAVSVLTNFGGVVYEGMDQHPLYYRSLDAGQTWDVVDFIIPGLDSSFYDGFAGESYNIDANGETVAIGVFDSWGDVAVFKSIDNGATWTKTIINDFPLDKYDGSGYGPEDIPLDPNAPDSVSISTADYSGSVLIDNNGKVHVFFGRMYVFATGADQFLFLDSEGIAYWNEDFGSDSTQTIANLQDFDGDEIVTISGDVGDLRYNNTGATSFPSAGVDADGNLYVVYTAFREDFTIDDKSYRHIFIIKSEDGGLTWSEPFDLINEETTEFPEFIEAAYPSIPARIGNSIELIYQADLEPGLSGTNVPEQMIMHLSLDKNTFGMVSALEDIPQLATDVTLVPNPADDFVQVNFELTESATVNLEVFNMLGALVGQKSPKSLSLGHQSEVLNVSRLDSGVYFVRLRIDGNSVTKKVIVE